jgi:hypothetical protein
MRNTLVFFAISGGICLAISGAACATTATVPDDPLPATKTDRAPSLPPPSNTDTPPAADDPPSPPGSSSGGTTKKDASPPPPPPPPPPPIPQICINEAGPPLAVQTPCGCDKDCTTGLVCAEVGALLDPWCCAPLGGECADYNDCCGEMLCVTGDGGKKTCK